MLRNRTVASSTLVALCALLMLPASAEARAFDFFFDALRARGDARAAPKGRPNIVEVAQATPELSILVEAVVKAGLVETLAEGEDLTVFAPTNDAFVALLGDLGIASLDDVPAEAVADILLDHVVASSNGANRLRFLDRRGPEHVEIGFRRVAAGSVS